jgi:CBS domain-containing protein
MMNSQDVAPGRDEDAQIQTAGGRASIGLLTGDVVDMVPSDASIRRVAEELVADEVGLLVVGSDDHVEGVVSERDVVRAVALGLILENTPVREVASTRVVWCDVTATVDEVAEVMMEQYVRHVLVEGGGRLVGVVSARDLLGAYVAASN